MEKKAGPKGGEPKARAARLPALRFHQLDIDFDRYRSRCSAWGSVRLRFMGRNETLYFNLTVGERWAVRNVPVLSREGKDKAQETWFSFPLGNSEGERVRTVDYGYALTPRPLAAAPRLAAKAAVTPRRYRLRQGIRGPRDGGKGIKPKNPVPVDGDRADGPKVTHADFPNQECGRNECVPAAISNSLKFLNKKHNLGIPDDQISIDKLKRPTGWKRKSGCPDGWQEGKKAYVDSENRKTGKQKFPVETTVPNQPGGYAERIYDAIRRGCDVEIVANRHCVAVTGAQKLKNGRYSFDLTHDSAQEKGEAITETVTYNPNTNTVLAGAPWIANEKIVLVVIECPKKIP